MKIVISEEYEYLREWLSSICNQEIVTDDMLHNGRNKIILCSSPTGEKFALKKYKRHDLIKKVAYTFFKQNKAKRAYENARELRARGFNTPREVAYIEEWENGLITQVYYICAYTERTAISEQLASIEPFDRDLATSYAEFVALLHHKGVLHVDLNSTNVLFCKEGENYSFELIDINRMCFYENEVPKAECMRNLTLFWHFDNLYRHVLNIYARTRHWSSKDIEVAVQIKLRHDKNWIRKKKFTGFLKRCFQGKR